MATNLGLIRYNGLDAKKYDINRNDSSSMANDEIWVLYTDKLGELWIGANSGLSKYNPECDCFYQYPSNIEDVTLALIRSITEDNNNNIWIGTFQPIDKAFIDRSTNTVYVIRYYLHLFYYEF